jgi:hypothetical protein
MWRQVPLGLKKLSCCTLLDVLKVQNIFECDGLKIEKVVRYRNKNRPDLQLFDK